jgi:mannosyltransferase OCH1-like enzyme
MIPKIIHQIWLGDKNLKPTKLMETWKNMNPTWEYMFWTEDNLPDLICQKQFNDMNEYCGKADILRYEILSKYGGFYIDADSECVNELDDFLIEQDSFACFENEQVRGDLIANGYLACTPNNELIIYMINKIKNIDNINNNAPWIVTGPLFLTKSIKELKYDKIKIYPSYKFIPTHLTGLSYNGKDKIYAKQYWGSTLGYEKIK